MSLPHSLLLLTTFTIFSPQKASTHFINQSYFFTLLQNSLSPTPPSFKGVHHCTYTGIVCNSHGDVTSISITNMSFSRQFPTNICSFLPSLRSLLLQENHMAGTFPHGITNCTFLENLNISGNLLTGTLPDFSQLKYLKTIDLSYNLFTGEFPTSVANLTNLVELVVNELLGLTPWKLPVRGFPLFKNLKTMILTSCMLTGTLPPAMGNITSLENLQLSGNFLTGDIPREIGRLYNLKLMEMYYQRFTGNIPPELGNLTLLKDLDLSVNRLTGGIPESVCNLPSIRVLQLYNNSLSGELPEALGNSTSLSILSLYANSFTGRIPPSMGVFSCFIGVDLSENNFSGDLPEKICTGEKLLYFLALGNRFTGGIPENYAKCKSLLRFRVSYNLLNGSIPKGIMGLPHVSIMDMSFNYLSGSLDEAVGNAGNLSELFLQGNRISGVIPVEICRARNMVKLDLSSNLLSGQIPRELGDLHRLNILLLYKNKLNSSIPDSLYSLKSLNYIDISDNLLTGVVDERISNLLQNSINFSHNLLSGPLPLCIAKVDFIESFKGNPGLCSPVHLHSPYGFPLCPLPSSRKIKLLWMVLCSSLFFFVVVVFVLILLKCWLREKKAAVTLSHSLCSYEVKRFHRVKLEVRYLMAGMVEKNELGRGRFGTVYKIKLGDGEVVAVKKQWRRKDKEVDMELEKELKTEVGTLGSIRHKNIVKLFCYFSGLECNILVFEYMENGSLWDAIHEKGIVLDWPCRYQIAVGIAHGLAYLHHSLVPPIVHRDIKSTNILLDVDYNAKVADFGLAKVLQGYEEKDTATIAGTYGYLAPEIVHSAKATTKCDVYSYGVVLMELVTGRKPVDSCYGENKNIVCWVSGKLEGKGGVLEVLDKRISSSIFLDKMIQMLRIALRCTYMSPLLRPSMNEVTEFLNDIDPSK